MQNQALKSRKDDNGYIAKISIGNACSISWDALK